MIKNFTNLLLTFATFLMSLSAYPQKPLSFLGYDSTIFENTMEIVYEHWNKSDLAEKYEIDTILCYFIVYFDTLNLFRDDINDSILKNNMRIDIYHLNEYNLDYNSKIKYNPCKRRNYLQRLLGLSGLENKKDKGSTRSILVPPDSSHIIYECACEIMDKENQIIASLGSMQKFYVFENHTGLEFSDYLTLHLLKYKDKLVFRPASTSEYVFNYKWRGAISRNGDLVWYNIDDPKNNYTFRELMESKNRFIISSH